MGRYSPNADWEARHDPDVPALSLIVAVDAIHEGTQRSLDDMLKVVGESPCEVIVAPREFWPGASPEVTVVSCRSASRGDRFDRAASRAHGRILAFLDDRARLPDGWVQRVIEVFDDPAISVASGPVLPRSGFRAERISALLLNCLDLGAIPPWSGLRSGRVLLVRADVFREAGGFQSPGVSDEVARLCNRLSLAGYDVVCHPQLAAVATPWPFPGPFLAETTSYGRARGEVAGRLVVAAARRFSSRLWTGAVSYGRARDDMAGGRFREDVGASPFRPFAVPALVALFVILELGLVLIPPYHPTKAELAGGSLLLALYLMQAGRVAFARGPARISDRVLAALAAPVVTFTYGVAFIRGLFGLFAG
jgi:hypothetical protein